jgi:hypothetical protein
LIDAIHHRLEWLPCKEFIGRFTSTTAPAVVVNDQNFVWDQQLIKMLSSCRVDLDQSVSKRSSEMRDGCVAGMFFST